MSRPNIINGLAEKLGLSHRQVRKMGTATAERMLLMSEPARAFMVSNANRKEPLLFHRTTAHIPKVVRPVQDKIRMPYADSVAFILSNITGDRTRIVRGEVQRWTGSRWVRG
jgi:hypothetical protein